LNDLYSQRHKERTYLVLRNIAVFTCRQIIDLTKQGHYQLACGRLFELKNNTDFKFAPQHPNQYFEESRKLLAGDQPDPGSS
jgi:DNA primase large subunit